MKRRPLEAPGNSKALTQKMIRMINSNGIMMLATRSMPLAMPRLITRKLRTRKITVQPTQRQGLATNAVNMSLYSCGVCPLRLPSAA